MAGKIIRDQKVFYGGNNLTAEVSSIAFEASAETLDASTLGLTSRKRQAGLKSYDFSLEALFDAPLEEAVLGAQGQDLPLSFTTDTSQIGDAAIIMTAGMGNIKLGGAVGELWRHSAEAFATTQVARGFLACDGHVTADGLGVGVNLPGGVPEGKKLVVAIHAYDVATGDTVEVEVKSAATNAFSGGGTSRAISDVFTENDSQLIEIDGPITHPWYRATWDVEGTSPNVGFAVFIGIK